MLEQLLVIEEQIKVEKKNTHKHGNNKNLKNPCLLHNGHHEWDDCQEKSKNKKEHGNTDNNNWETNKDSQVITDERN
jgi:hypothetical protein